MPHFLDTNILLYSISRNPAESRKREAAIRLLAGDAGTLSIQVLQEFYAQATRTTRPDRIPHDLAVGLIDAWSRFRIQEMNLAVLRSALQICKSHNLSFWDSAVIAAALELGCDRVYTEDLNHRQVIGGLTIINPFV